MKYKILSVFLAVLVAFTFGANSFNVRSSAEAATTIAVSGLVSVLGSALIYCINELIDESPYLSQYYINAVNNNAVQNGELIEIWQDSDGSYHFQSLINPNDPNYSDDDKAFNKFICDYYNYHIDKSAGRYLSEFKPIGTNTNVSASAYSQFKRDAVNAYINYCENNERIKETGYGDMADWLADYFNFDITSAVSNITSPTTISPKEFSTEGFYFLSLNVAPASYSDWTSSEGAASNWNSQQVDSQWITVNGSSFPVYRGYVYTVGTVYGVGWCVIYNGKPYFMPIVNKSATPLGSGAKICSNIIPDNCIYQFISADGESLSTAGCSTIVGCSYCPYYITDPNVEYNYPRAISSEDDFYDITPGGSTEVPMTANDALINKAITLGIVSDNPEITLNPDGTIAAVDGIPIDTIANLVSQLSNGVHFEDIKGYLDHIALCLDKANVNTDTINRILNNIKNFSERSANAIDEINEAIPGIKQGIDDMTDDLSDIKDNIQTITDELTSAHSAELEKENIELDTIVGNHTGLYEANAFVSRWTLVNQFKGLLYNLLDENNYNNSPPNLNFYADMDKDGVKEKYTAIDFSFLETPLTNENLEDKSRFQNPMTVREFIQSLLILICYAAFTIKVLRKLPGLVSGGESAAGDGLELKSVTDTKKEMDSILSGKSK